ncbi:MAG: T9SS type A sorting domain-containing protein [Saprospiraceae bacterium]
MTLTLIMSVFSFRALGQSYYYLYGDNTFRSYLQSGDLNHNYRVGTKYDANPLVTYGPFNTNWGNQCGIYEAVIKLNNNGTSNVNELRVRPTCPNTPADYLDGCTTMDLVLIDRHVAGIQPFTDGYQKIAADVNKSNSITTDDKTMLQQLILGYTTSFTRNSWEWFEPAYMNQFPTGFFNAPWQYCLSAIWPNVGGFGERRWTALSRNEIQTNYINYFWYRTVKIGDVGRGNSSVAPNSYICLPPQYFGDSNTGSRSVIGESLIQQVELKQNDEIEVSITVDVNDDLSAIMLPIFIDDQYFEITEVEFLNDFIPKYHYSKEFKTLTILDVTSDPNAKIDIVNGELVIVRLKVKQKIANVFDHIGWERNLRNIELINMRAEYTEGDVSLELKNIYPSQERLHILQRGTMIELYSMIDENSNIAISSIDGRTLHSIHIKIEKGINNIEIPDFLPSGIYVATMRNNGKIISEKFVK